MIEPFAQALFGHKELTEDERRKVYEAFGFNRTPQLQVQTAAPISATAHTADLHVSPLQVALASAVLSNHGIAPAPRLAISVNTPTAGWIVLPTPGTSFQAIPASQANEAAQSFTTSGGNDWSHIGRASGDESQVTWFIAGTPPNWQATPLVVVVALEEDNERIAQYIGQELLTAAMNP
jgi:hypothetical protein